MASKTHTTTISLPHALWERMQAVRGQVNWSRVAARAFEQELLGIELRSKRTMAKEDIVKRLKATQEAGADEEYQDGKQAGREWAEREATAKELKRISEYIEMMERQTGSHYNWWDVDYSGWMAPFGATDYFVVAGRPSRKEDRGAPEEFWEEALGDDKHRIEDADFFHGFGDGVAEVWNEVSHEL
jgi:hypothetical protein